MAEEDRTFQALAQKIGSDGAGLPRLVFTTSTRLCVALPSSGGVTRTIAMSAIEAVSLSLAQSASSSLASATTTEHESGDVVVVLVTFRVNNGPVLVIRLSSEEEALGLVKALKSSPHCRATFHTPNWTYVSPAQSPPAVVSAASTQAAAPRFIHIGSDNGSASAVTAAATGDAADDGGRGPSTTSTQVGAGEDPMALEGEDDDEPPAFELSPLSASFWSPATAEESGGTASPVERAKATNPPPEAAAAPVVVQRTPANGSDFNFLPSDTISEGSKRNSSGNSGTATSKLPSQPPLLQFISQASQDLDGDDIGDTDPAASPLETLVNNHGGNSSSVPALTVTPAIASSPAATTVASSGRANTMRSSEGLTTFDAPNATARGSPFAPTPSATPVATIARMASSSRPASSNASSRHGGSAHEIAILPSSTLLPCSTSAVHDGNGAIEGGVGSSGPTWVPPQAPNYWMASAMGTAIGSSSGGHSRGHEPRAAAVATGGGGLVDSPALKQPTYQLYTQQQRQQQVRERMRVRTRQLSECSNSSGNTYSNTAVVSRRNVTTATSDDGDVDRTAADLRQTLRVQEGLLEQLTESRVEARAALRRHKRAEAAAAQHREALEATEAQLDAVSRSFTEVLQSRDREQSTQHRAELAEIQAAFDAYDERMGRIVTQMQTDFDGERRQWREERTALQGLLEGQRRHIDSLLASGGGGGGSRGGSQTLHPVDNNTGQRRPRHDVTTASSTTAGSDNSNTTVITSFPARDRAERRLHVYAAHRERQQQHRQRVDPTMDDYRSDGQTSPTLAQRYQAWNQNAPSTPSPPIRRRG